ncbi:HAD family hydrolase, partial [Peribacillus sp. NPDC060186]
MNKPEIKLVALDMDGTLLNEAGEISAENRKAIKEAENQGVFVVLSTGRSYATCSDFAKSMELQSYLITVNGSEIYDNQGILVERNIVDSESIQWM